MPYTIPRLSDAVKGAALVLSGLDYQMIGLAASCKAQRVPYVLVSEYSLLTRLQIARSSPKGPLRTAWSMLWEMRMERHFLNDVRTASGIQCNGTPTYNAYRSLIPDAFLYFDTRTNDGDLASEERLIEKARRLETGAPLRLAFSGRLNPMKGAQELPRVAEALTRLGIDFTFDICGDGPSRAEMESTVRSLGLDGKVRFRGVLNFATELLPFLSKDIDLFVCCHTQGDPSCTYLETFGCGVPIIGYANEAFAGLLEHTPAGLASPLRRPKALADKIADFARNRPVSQWMGWARSGLEFARENTFDRTFARRVDHMKAILARHNAG